MVSLVDIIVFDLLMMWVFVPHTAHGLPEFPSPSDNDTMTATQDISKQQVSKHINAIRNPPVRGGLFRSNLWDRGRANSLTKRTLIVRPLSKNPPSISFEGPAGYEVIVAIQVIKNDEV